MTLDERIASARATLAGLGGELRYGANPGAPDAVLGAAEMSLAIPLAQSHRSFLAARDGCTIEIRPHRGRYAAGIEIFGATELVERTLEYRRVYGDWGNSGGAGFWRQLLVVGRADSGDNILADAEVRDARGEYPILDGFSEDPDSWRKRVIAASFGDVVDRIFDSMIAGHVPQYWIGHDTTIAAEFAVWPLSID